MAFSAIIKPTDYFNTILWNGNSSTQAITGVGFAPDFVWGKQRSGTEPHQVLDKIRGANNILTPNTSAAALADSQILNSFDSDGFTLGNQNQLNDTGATYASWNWKGGGTGVSNAEGDITSTVSANTTSGVSIIKFTGNSSTSQSFGHGLNGTPKIWFIKNISVGGDNWQVYIDGIRLKLDTTEVGEANYLMTANATTITTPSSSGAGWGNYNGQDFMVYAFQNIQGFSKAGSYTGNGNADGTFIYTGFKVGWILIKDSGRAESWYIFDNRRLGYNGGMADLIANSTATESGSSATLLDFLSNGFKLTGTTDHLNGSGQNFIYMAFAETPFVANSGESIPTTAR